MKLLIIATALIGSMAFAADGLVEQVAKDGGVNSACANTILSQVEKRCNADSLKAEGKDRMNPCQDFDADIAASGQYKGQLEAGGAAGDADMYWYVITIRDAGSCKFGLTSEQ
jgi:hypothetical protein